MSAFTNWLRANESRNQKAEAGKKAANFQLCVSSFPLLPSGFSAPRRRALSISSRLAATRVLAPSTTEDNCQSPSAGESKVDSCLLLFPTYHLPSTTYRLFYIPHLPPIKYLCFQQHSRFKGLSSCVFIDIPASLPSRGRPVLCFHRHSRFVPSKKEFIFNVGRLC